MNYLLDTCVISEIIKPEPNQKVIGWIAEQSEQHLFLSVIVLGEIQKGISKLSSSKKKAALQLWLQNDLQERFNGRIVPINEDVALNWGIIQASAEQQGKIIPSIDGLIAATAVAYKMTVVTRNVQDMAASGVQLLNPWES